jgi:hypothetical protein
MRLIVCPLNLKINKRVQIKIFRRNNAEKTALGSTKRRCYYKVTVLAVFTTPTYVYSWI